MYSVSFVGAKEGTGLADADLTVDTVQLPLLIVLEADLVRLEEIDFLDCALIVLLSGEFQTRIRLHDKRIIALGLFRISVKTKASTRLQRILLI